MRILMILCLTLIVSVAHAQSSKKKKEPKASDAPKRATSLEPYYPQTTAQPSRKSTKKRDGGGPSYDSEKEYFARLESLEKEKRKNEKMMERPQYSDHSYFGHKRPPKKRAPSKMKFCKVCGIRH